MENDLINGVPDYLPQVDKVSFLKKHFDKDYIDLYTVGDTHIGNPLFDKTLFEKTLDEINKVNGVIVGTGDYTENACKSSIGSGVYDQTLDPNHQIEAFIRYMFPLRDKILGLLKGNHGDRTDKDSGVSPDSLISMALQCKYLGWGNFLYITVGNQDYTIYPTHGYAAARTLGGKVNAIQNLAKMVEADIYLMGHVHSLMAFQELIWTITSKGPKVKERTFGLTGHYLTKWDSESYITHKAYTPQKGGSLHLRLYGDKKKVETII